MADAPTPPIPIAELDHGPSKLDIFLEKNQKKLLIAALLIFLGVIGYVFYSGLEKMKNEEAGAAALVATTEEDYTKIISEFGDRPVAGTAALSIADLRTNDADAISALQHYIANYPDHHAVPEAELKLAMKQLNAGKISDASISLASLISRANADHLVPAAKITLGDIAASNNEIEKAQTLYQEAIDHSTTFNVFAATAQDRLNFLKAKKPELVTPKVVPATPLSPLKPLTPLKPATPVKPITPVVPVTPAPPVEPTTPTKPATPQAAPENN